MRWTKQASCPAPSVSLGGGGGGLTPAELNTVFKADSMWIPAAAWVPLETDGPTADTIYMSNTDKARDCLVFADGSDQYCDFFWAQTPTWIKWSAPAFRLRVFGTVISDPVADTVARFGIEVSNVDISDDEEDNATYPFGTRKEWNTPRRSSYDLYGGVSGISDDAAVLMNGPGGRAYDTTALATNAITFRFSRQGADPLDTLGVDFYLYGIAIQWAVDFTNNGLWATS